MRVYSGCLLRGCKWRGYFALRMLSATKRLYMVFQDGQTPLLYFVQEILILERIKALSMQICSLRTQVYIWTRLQLLTERRSACIIKILNSFYNSSLTTTQRVYKELQFSACSEVWMIVPLKFISQV